MADLTGRVLKNRYHVEAHLGRGGMAEVYKVWDFKRMTFLALKLLHEDLAQDRIFLRRFQSEADTLVKLQHPNIDSVGEVKGRRKQGRTRGMGVAQRGAGRIASWIAGQG